VGEGAQVEVVCNLRDDVRRVYVTESIALHELRQRLCAEYGAEALDIRYRGDDGEFGPMHTEHHLEVAKAMASQAACALYLSLAAQGSDDFSTLGLGAPRPLVLAASLLLRLCCASYGGAALSGQTPAEGEARPVRTARRAPRQ